MKPCLMLQDHSRGLIVFSLLEILLPSKIIFQFLLNLRYIEHQKIVVVGDPRFDLYKPKYFIISDFDVYKKIKNK